LYTPQTSWTRRISIIYTLSGFKTLIIFCMSSGLNFKAL
jgi:hypothetical protein